MATRSTTAGSSRWRAKLLALPGTARRQASRAALAAAIASRKAMSAADNTAQKRSSPTAITACRRGGRNGGEQSGWTGGGDAGGGAALQRWGQRAMHAVRSTVLEAQCATVEAHQRERVEQAAVLLGSGGLHVPLP